MGAVLVFMLVAASFWLLNTYRAGRPASEPVDAPAGPGVEPVDVGPQTLNELLTQGKPLVLEFYNSSSQDCARMAPEIARLNAAVGRSLFVVKMNAEKYPAEPPKYGAPGFPTLVLFDGSGVQKATLAGYRDYEALVQALKSAGLVK